MKSDNSSSRKFRIAVLNRNFGHHFGGAERYATTLVEKLAGHHEIHVFAQEIEHNFPGVTYHIISRPIGKPRWINQLWFAIETWRKTRSGFDVVHSHENIWHGDIQTVHVRPLKTGLFKGTQGLLRIFKWIGILTSPRLITYLGLEAKRYSIRPRLRIVATSEQVMQDMQEAYPDARTLLHVITPGVNLPTALYDVSAAKKKLNLPLNSQIALFVGNDYAKKGLGTLLITLSMLPNLHLAVVGKGQDLMVFKRQSQQLNIEDRVHFLGSIHDMTEAYSAADVLVHPTTEDSDAMAVLEAMAHDLPVIVSSASYCGISADLTYGEQALILDNPRDAQTMASEVQRCLTDTQLRERLRREGKKFASERSWDEVAKLHEKLLDISITGTT